MKKTSFNLIQGQKELKVDCQYDDRNQVTALISGKSKEIRKGKKLKDKSQYPLNLVLAESKLKLNMQLSTEEDSFLLYINSINFHQLPYKFDLVEEADMSVKYKAEVQFDETEITLPQPWSNRDFISNFQEQLPSEDHSFADASMSFDESSSSAVINEILDATVSLNNVQDGLFTF